MNNLISIKTSISKLKYSDLIKHYEKSSLCREELSRRVKTLIRKPNRRPEVIIDNNK